MVNDEKTRKPLRNSAAAGEPAGICDAHVSLADKTRQEEWACKMSEETFQLYSTLTVENREKVSRLIETLLGQQLNDQQSPDSQA